LKEPLKVPSGWVNVFVFVASDQAPPHTFSIEEVVKTLAIDIAPCLGNAGSCTVAALVSVLVFPQFSKVAVGGSFLSAL
jgi:hypothetical protein